MKKIILITLSFVVFFNSHVSLAKTSSNPVRKIIDVEVAIRNANNIFKTVLKSKLNATISTSRIKNKRDIVSIQGKTLKDLDIRTEDIRNLVTGCVSIQSYYDTKLKKLSGSYPFVAYSPASAEEEVILTVPATYIKLTKHANNSCNGDGVLLTNFEKINTNFNTGNIQSIGYSLDYKKSNFLSSVTLKSNGTNITYHQLNGTALNGKIPFVFSEIIL